LSSIADKTKEKSKNHSYKNNVCSQRGVTWQPDATGFRKCDVGLPSHLFHRGSYSNSSPESFRYHLVSYFKPRVPISRHKCSQSVVLDFEMNVSRTGLHHCATCIILPNRQEWGIFCAWSQDMYSVKKRSSCGGLSTVSGPRYDHDCILTASPGNNLWYTLKRTRKVTIYTSLIQRRSQSRNQIIFL
jgi:hypothetical protein